MHRYVIQETEALAEIRTWIREEELYLVVHIIAANTVGVHQIRSTLARAWAAFLY